MMIIIGTDLHANAITKSDEYAKKFGVEPYKYVLHPRTTGTVHLIEHTRQQIDAIYDVTIVCYFTHNITTSNT
jgi:lysocardiolipin and lysophospholipid acyltransferase